jgi:hypothetical protein
MKTHARWLTRWVAGAFVIGTIACITSFAQGGGGGALKIDDTTLAGEIIAFDGRQLTIETKDEKNQATRQTIAVEDLLQVRLTGGSPTTAPATQPGAVNAVAGATEGATPQQKRSAMARVLQWVGLASAGKDGPSTPGADGSAPPSAPTTQQAALLPVWQVKLTNGDSLHGALRGWSNQRLSLAIDKTDLVLDIPADRIAELWHGSAEQVRKARGLHVEAGGGDVAYVIKDADLVAVQGVALGVGQDALNFRYEGQDRAMSLGRVLGVALLASKPAGAQDHSAGSFHQSFRLGTGDVISGTWASLRDGSIALTTQWGQEIRLPAGSVNTIDFRNGRVVYLSDLKPARVEQTPYFDRVIPWRADAALDGGPLALADGRYDRGIAVHARCVLEYELGGQFDRFRTIMGFEQPAGAAGRATVRVRADGKPIYEKADARGDGKPQTIDVPLAGARALVLEVDFGRDQDVGDRVIWANARLVRGHVAP